MGEKRLTGGVPSLESLHSVRLTALLRYEEGKVRVAEVLNYKTLATAMESGRLTPRLWDALDRLRSYGAHDVRVRSWCGLPRASRPTPTRPYLAAMRR